MNLFFIAKYKFSFLIGRLAYSAVLSWIAVTPLFGGLELERLGGSLVVNLSYRFEKRVKNSRFHAQFDYDFCSKCHRNNELLS